MSDPWGDLRPDQMKSVVAEVWHWLQQVDGREQAAEQRNSELIAAIKEADQNAERRHTELTTAIGSLFATVVTATAAGLREAANALERGIR